MRWRTTATLAAAAATLTQTEELAAAKAGTLAPQVGATGGIGRQKYGAEFLGSSPKPPPFTYFAVGATISYALDYTGGVARAVEERYALADYQRQQLEAARLAVSGNAVVRRCRSPRRARRSPRSKRSSTRIART